jgi:hypothetical protein
MIALLRRRADKIPLYLFYIGLTIELLLVLYDRSAIPALEQEGLIYRWSFAFFTLKICFTKYTRKEWAWLLLFGAFTAMMYLITGVNLALRAVVFVAAMRGIEIRPVFKYSFWLTLSGTLVIAVLSFFNIGRGVATTEVFREVLETRYSFGFGHPNTFHFTVLALVLMFMYAYQEGLKLFVYALLFVVNYGLYLFSDSRTAFAICSLAIVVAVFFYLLPKARQANCFYFLGMFALVFCLAFSVVAAYYADSTPSWESGSMIARLNRILVTRISHVYWANPEAPASLSNWTLFSEASHFDLYFDMGWVRMFYWFGIIPGLVFSGLHLVLLNECRKQKDYMALVLIVVAAIYTVLEANLISAYLARNCLLFLFGLYWGGMLKADEGEDVYWWGIYTHAAKA